MAARWLAMAAVAACGGAPALLGPGDECSLAVDCAPGLVCVRDRQGIGRCSSDLSTLGGEAPPAGDGAAPDGDGAPDAGPGPAPPDPSGDAATPGEDAAIDGAPPPVDAAADSGDGG